MAAIFKKALVIITIVAGVQALSCWTNMTSPPHTTETEEISCATIIKNGLLWGFFFPNPNGNDQCKSRCLLSKHQVQAFCCCNRDGCNHPSRLQFH